jgi:alpha-tubulin suppressor-like RCC1 family protein
MMHGAASLVGARATKRVANGVLAFFLSLSFLALARPADAAVGTAVAITAGYDHSCLITGGGRAARCWGDNSKGQLGNGSTVGQAAPVSVSGLSSKTASIDAGVQFTCALTTGGGVKCWGQNGSGQTGSGAAFGTIVTKPANVAGLGSGVSRIAVGAAHACALTTGGAVRCWGSDSRGALGNGDPLASSNVPVQVSGLSAGVVSVTTGYVHSCALLSSGEVRCWGYNAYGQVGDGTIIDRSTPVTVPGLSGVTAIVAGGYNTCARDASGWRCWGEGTAGQLGDGLATDSLVPVAVSGLAPSADLNGGAYHMCAIDSGTPSCWGSNIRGELGDGSTTNRSVPTPVVGLSSAGAISGGRLHTCAVTTTGSAYCWGANTYGQLGNGGVADAPTPAGVVGYS